MAVGLVVLVDGLDDRIRDPRCIIAGLESPADQAKFGWAVLRRGICHQSNSTSLTANFSAGLLAGSSEGEHTTAANTVAADEMHENSCGEKSNRNAEGHIEQLGTNLQTVHNF